MGPHRWQGGVPARAVLALLVWVADERAVCVPILGGTNMYTHIHTYTHTHIHTYTHTYTQTHRHAETQADMQTDQAIGDQVIVAFVCPRCQTALDIHRASLVVVGL